MTCGGRCAYEISARAAWTEHGRQLFASTSTPTSWAWQRFSSRYGQTPPIRAILVGPFIAVPDRRAPSPARDKDDIWIPEVAARGWLIVTRDSRISDNRAEIAVRDHGARMIALAGNEAVGTWAQLEVLSANGEPSSARSMSRDRSSTARPAPGCEGSRWLNECEANPASGGFSRVHNVEDAYTPNQQTKRLSAGRRRPSSEPVV